MKSTHLLLIALAFNFACQTLSKEKDADTSLATKPGEFIRNKEAREDSIKLTEAYALRALIPDSVVASFQTNAVEEAVDEDAADDPAFWYNQQKPESSVIYGSNKKGGIYAYDLTGAELAYYPVGEVNNIDVRQQTKIGNKTMDILGGSNRTNNSIYLMAIDTAGSLSDFGSLELDTTFVDEVYGFCLAKTKDNEVLAIANGKNGQIAAYTLDLGKQNVSFELVHQWKLATQPEGMVADDRTNTLYVGEEESGIWKMALSADSTPIQLAASTSQANNRISYDIEGLSLYKMENPWHASGVLIASIQGSFSYAVFDLSDDNNYLGSFKIVDSQRIDGVEETDGLEVVNYDLSPAYPKGILIVQDGFNLSNGEAVSQNFKIVNMEDILKFWIVSDSM